MKRLPNIDIDVRSINRLFMSSNLSGGEAVICRSFKPNTLFKIFADSDCQKYSDSFGVPFRLDLIQMSDNKFKKITELYQKDLEHSVKPLSTISMGGRLIGYEMTWDPNDKNLLNTSLSHEELVHALTQSRKILEYYAQNDITYGDVNACNLLVNRQTGQVKFCDIDNICLGEYPIDIMGRDLTVYSILRGIDQSTDAYMHNIMTLSQLDKTGIGFCFEPVSRLVQKDFSEVLTEEAQETLTSMIEPKNFNGEYVVQYIKK